MKKFLIISISIVVLIIVALFLFIKIYVTPERVKGFVVPTAEQALNRKIDIGDIKISIFKGIGLSDFAIKESDGTADFVKCREFVLKFKLLPLLTRQLVIDELRLVSPMVMIKRGKDGKFNFEDSGKKKKPEKAKKAETPGETGEEGGLPISLLVNTIAISDARFSLEDRMQELPDLKSTTNVNISIESVDGSDISTKGSIDLKLDELVLKKPAEKRLKDIKASLTYAVNVNVETMNIRMDKVDLIFQEIPMSLTGTVKNLKTSPEIDIAFTLSKVQTSVVQKVLSSFADVKGLNLTGSVAAEVKLKGATDKIEAMKADGGLLLDKVGIAYNDINALVDGSVSFNEKTATIQITTTVGTNTAEIKGSVSSYFKNQDINLNVYSKKLLLHELIPAGAPEEKAPEKKKEAKPAPDKPAKEAEPLALTLTAKGEVKIDSAVFKEITMNNFYMKYQFKNNKLDIPELSAATQKGKVSLSSAVDLSKPGYTYRLTTNVESLEAVNFVNSFAPKAKDTVFGLLSLNLKMNGAGTLPDSMKKNLSADGDFNIAEGKITNAQITEKLALFLNTNELKSIDLQKGKGTFKARNKVVRLDSVFSSDSLSMDPSGDIGLDETLDLAIDLKLSPRLTDKAMSSSIGKYIKSDEGWGEIPLLVKGTFAKPSYTINIEKAGKRAIKKEADKFIDKLIEKKGGDKEELAPVKDLLKGIFK